MPIRVTTSAVGQGCGAEMTDRVTQGRSELSLDYPLRAHTQRQARQLREAKHRQQKQSPTRNTWKYVKT